MQTKARKSLSWYREWLVEQSRCIVVPLLVLCLVGLSVGINVYRYTRGVFALYPIFAGNVLLVAKCFVCIAEVCFGLLLLPVSRGFITWLRSTWLRHIVDFDTALNFHAWLAAIGIVAGTVHGICATVAYINVGRIPLAIQAAVGRDPKDVKGMLLSWNILSGWGLFTLALITFPFALKWPRQAPWLKDTRLGKILNNPDWFWVTHHILIIVFVPVAVMHSIKWTPGFPTKWEPGFLLATSKFLYYIAVPILVYLFNRLRRMATASHLALLVDAGVVGGDVLALKMLKPRFFTHKPGQYLFMCCPKISPYEWHPFTITSAPQDGYISVHIKRSGDWTGALHDLFKPACGDYSSGQPSSTACNMQQLLLPSTTANSSNTASQVTAKRRISVEQVAAQLTAGAAAIHGYVSRRSTAQEGVTADATAASGVSTGVVPALRRSVSRVRDVVSGAWDPRAERVITEAEDRLKQAAAEVAGGVEAECGVHGPANPAYTAFSEYRSSTTTIDAVAPTSGTATAAVENTQAVCSGQTVVYGNAVNGAGKQGVGIRAEEFVPPLLYIDGPFGAPTQDFEHYKVVVLVGTGIGITPMASVLRSLMHDLYDARCDVCGTMNRRLCRMRQSKVYVHWVARSLEGMAWFEELLSSVNAVDVDNVFQFNVHITRSGKNNNTGAPTTSSIATNKAISSNQVAPECGTNSAVTSTSSSAVSAAQHAATGSVVVKALAPASKATPGLVNYSYKRPDMVEHLTAVQAAHAGEYVGVFFCGPKVMGQQVHHACLNLNAAATEAADAAAYDTEHAACAKPCRLCFHEEIF